MRIAYYIAYNPITKTYVGVLKRAHKRKLELLATSIYYDKYQGNFAVEGKTYDLNFSADVLPELVKIFNNRMTNTLRYYSSEKANRAVVYFVVPDGIASNFPGEFSKYKYVVATFDIKEIKDLRDAERIYMYDTQSEARDNFSMFVEELKFIDRYYGKGGGPKVGSTLTRLRSSDLPSKFSRLTRLRSSDLPSKFSRLTRLRRISEGSRRFERSGSSWDFLS